MQELQLLKILIWDGLFRVDIMLNKNTNTLVLNEFESFEAGHEASDVTLNGKVYLHLQEFWGRIVCGLTSGFSI